MKGLGPSQSGALNGIPGFIIKVAPLFKYIIDLSFSKEQFPIQWKEAVVVPIWKEGNSSSVSNYRHIYLSVTLPKVLIFIQDHKPNYFKHKLNTSQHGFTKPSLLQQICNLS